MEARVQDVIFKYPLKFGEDTIIALPERAHHLHVAVQDNTPQLWIRHATVREGDPKWDHAFCIVATGQPFPESAFHIGTFLSGPYVWHVLKLPF